MSKLREIWNEYLKEPVKKWVTENLFYILQSLVKNVLKKKKFKEEPKVEEKSRVAEGNPYEIRWEQSPNFSSRRRDTVKAIVLHHTGKGGLKAAKSWVKNKKSQVSYHYIIDRNGDIYQLVKDEHKAWHAGKSTLLGRNNVNTFSIGIAFVSDGKDKYTRNQYDSGAWLCRKLKDKYGITNNYIVGHKTVAPERKHDPANFDWDQLWDRHNLRQL